MSKKSKKIEEEEGKKDFFKAFYTWERPPTEEKALPECNGGDLSVLHTAIQSILKKSTTDFTGFLICQKTLDTDWSFPQLKNV